MENSDSRTESGASPASLTTAGHRPTQDNSPPPPGRTVCDDECCDLVTVPARQGLEAVDILRRGAGDTIGPVLHDGGCDTLGFLVPPGTADGWDLPGSACTQTFGRGMRGYAQPDPGPTVPEPPVAGTGWSCRRATRPTPSRTPRCCAPRSARRPAPSRPPTTAADTGSGRSRPLVGPAPPGTPIMVRWQGTGVPGKGRRPSSRWTAGSPSCADRQRPRAWTLLVDAPPRDRRPAHLARPAGPFSCSPCRPPRKAAVLRRLTSPVADAATRRSLGRCTVPDALVRRGLPLAIPHGPRPRARRPPPAQGLAGVADGWADLAVAARVVAPHPRAPPAGVPHRRPQCCRPGGFYAARPRRRVVRSARVCRPAAPRRAFPDALASVPARAARQAVRQRGAARRHALPVAESDPAQRERPHPARVEHGRGLDFSGGAAAVRTPTRSPAGAAAVGRFRSRLVASVSTRRSRPWARCRARSQKPRPWPRRP
ncbi:hypothetical protein SALBM135S_04092 [Streptomyces alboniger]